MLKINRGDTVSIAVNLFIDNAAYTPTEGETVVFSVKEKLGDSEPILLQRNVENGVLHLTHEDTKSLSCDRTYHYDVRLYNADKSKVLTPIIDQLKVCEVVNCDL